MPRSLANAVCVIVVIFGPVAAARAAQDPKPAPEIFAIDPPEGSAGTIIKVTGAGFEHTKQVLFSAGRTGQPAGFKVISDTELEVTAPPYFRAGTAATLVVVTPGGATVGMPASVLDVDQNQHARGRDATFYRVLAGGTLDSPQGIVLVESGGVSSAPAAVAIAFVKSGGTLLWADRFGGLIVCEPRAHLQTGPNATGSTTRVMKVPLISASLGIEPFLYYRPESPDTPAVSAPHVRSVSPGRVPSGGILTLHGTGFFGTSEVEFVAGTVTAGGHPADFRIISDTELEVEIPETLSGSVHPVVTNSKGTTLVVTQNDLGRHFSLPRRPTAQTPKNQRSRTQPPAGAVALSTANRDTVSVVPTGFMIVPP
jgi:hypothetical protein